MSNLPSKKELVALAQVLKNQELELKNKEAAKAALLRIQLMLAKTTK